MWGDNMAKRVLYKNGIKITIVQDEDPSVYLTDGDKEMDRRAKEAARAAIEKAKFLGNSVAYYDDEKKKAYLEYANGERKYAQ